MNLSNMLALLASGIVVLVYLAYFKQMVKEQSTPNPATWIIWLSVSILNAITYVPVADTWYQGLVSVVMSVSITILFIYAYKKQKFTSIKFLEKAVLLLTVIIGLIGLFIQNEEITNLLIQGVLVFSFWPTIDGLRNKGATEKPLPWLLAVGAYCLLIASILVDFNGNYTSLAFPLVNGILGNGIVAILAITKKN